jgi:hypothetical protein
MEGIELGKAIAEYGIPIITGIFLVLVCWLVKYLITQQTKDRNTFMNMFQNELKTLHKDSLLNAKLNRKSISMLGNLTEYLNRHFNGCADKVNFKKKTNEKG